MNTNTPAAMAATPRPGLAIFWGGLIAGVLDITSAFVAWGLRGVKPGIILRGIASGLLGPTAYTGGLAIAALGCALHFLIAFSAATVFYLASRKLKFMTRRAVLCGLIYGELVYFFMYYVVLPLSAFHKGAFTIETLLTGPIGHPLLIGLPIALSVRRFAR